MDPLELRLRHERAGAEQESCGRWTVDERQALRKLAEFQLPSSEHWVLKILQAAVAAGSSAVEIRTGRSGTEVRPGVGWSLSELRSELFQLDRSANRSLDQLKRGLWSAARGQGREVQLDVVGERTALSWITQQPELVTHSQPAPFTRLVVSHAPSTAGWLWRWRHAPLIAHRHAELASLLQRVAWPAPLAVSLDSRRLDSFGFCPSFNGPTSLQALVTVPGHDLTLNLSDLHGLPQLECPQLPQASAALLLGESVAPAPGQIFWLLDGIVVDQQRAPWADGPFAGVLLLSAADLPTDATGFLLTDSHARARRVEEMRRTLERRLGEFARQLEPRLDPQAPRPLRSGLRSRVAKLLVQWNQSCSNSAANQKPLHSSFYRTPLAPRHWL